MLNMYEFYSDQVYRFVRFGGRNVRKMAKWLNNR